MYSLRHWPRHQPSADCLSSVSTPPLDDLHLFFCNLILQSLHLCVRSVPFLQPLPEDVIMKMSDLVEEVRMKNKKCTKHCIVRPRLLDYTRKHSRWCSGSCCLQGGPLCIYHLKLSPCCISQQAGVGGHTANPSLNLLFASAGEEMHSFSSLPAFSPPVLYFHYAPMRFLCVPQMHYAEGDYIFRQGAAGDTFYIISKGQVKFFARAK